MKTPLTCTSIESNKDIWTMDEEEKPLLVRLVRNIGIALTIFVSEKRSKRERQMEGKKKKKSKLYYGGYP